MKFTAGRGRGGRSGTVQRPTIADFHPKDIAIHLFADVGLTMPMEEGECYNCTIRNKDGGLVSHRYTSLFSPISDTPPSRIRVVGVRTPGGGYNKGLFSALSPKEKREAELIASTPKRVKRHISPPPITRPAGKYESEDEKDLKGPKVVQLLRIVVAMKKDHKKLVDQVAELTLELKSLRDEYETFRRVLCSKVARLEKDKDLA